MQIIKPKERTCTRCKTTKSIDEFYKNCKSRGGHQTECKVCRKLRDHASRSSWTDVIIGDRMFK